MMVSMIASSAPIVPSSDLGRRRPSGDDLDAVQDQRIAGQDEEQQHPLEDLRGLVRDPQLHLRRLAAEIADRQQNAGKQHADRIQPAEESDDDRGEPVAG